MNKVRPFPAHPSQPIIDAITRLFTWIEEDYGPDVIPDVVADLLLAARARTYLSIEQVIEEVALDWSK